MKKFSKQTLRGFAAGVAASVLTATLIAPATAATMKQIKVAMGNIKIYVDGELQIPCDATGKQVEPMIYNGTTYLPVRALTSMLTNRPVTWDAAAQAVYIGAKPAVTLNASGENLILTAHGGPMRVLNTFLSSFSEASFSCNDSYTSGDTAKMIDFAFTYNLIHNSSALQYVQLPAGSYMTLPADIIAQTIREYFNTSITHQSTTQHLYQDNWYYAPPADGESYSYCSIADEMYKKPDGTWDVHFFVFSTPGMFITDLMDKREICFLRDVWMYNDLVFCYDGTATLGRKAEGGYYLISYKTVVDELQ